MKHSHFSILQCNWDLNEFIKSSQRWASTWNLRKACVFYKIITLYNNYSLPFMVIYIYDVYFSPLEHLTFQIFFYLYIRAHNYIFIFKPYFPSISFLIQRIRLHYLTKYLTFIEIFRNFHRCFAIWNIFSNNKYIWLFFFFLVFCFVYFCET